jgi:hypothetical protein
VTPRPCSPAEAVQRAMSMVGRPEPYILGTGDYRPRPNEDLPFTRNRVGYGSDCWGFAGAWCYKLPRHRQGFNRGRWATVSDDINTDSAIEDAEHLGEIYEVVKTPAPGDLLVYPSIRGVDRRRLRIGHVGIVLAVPPEWDATMPQYALLTVAQCQASRRPAIVSGAGSTWGHKETYKGLTDEAWRSRILRVRQ